MLNALSYRDLKNIWTPKMLFMNALGSVMTEVDDLTVANVDREGKGVIIGTEDPTEAVIFDGASNSILLRREYFFDFSCDFDLHLYPFDTQVCQMELEARRESGFIFDVEGHGVAYQCKCRKPF